MVRSKKAVRRKPKEYLSPSERQSLEGEKRELETTISEMDGSGKGTPAEQIDVGRLQGEIKRLDVAIQERTPAEARGIQKDKYIKEEKVLEETIGTGMPTWHEMRKPSMNPGAVRKHMNWCDRNQANIERYRELQRILRPMDPKSIENLRKEK